MLSAAHVLAMDAKNLLDVVDSIRISHPELFLVDGTFTSSTNVILGTSDSVCTRNNDDRGGYLVKNEKNLFSMESSSNSNDDWTYNIQQQEYENLSKHQNDIYVNQEQIQPSIHTEEIYDDDSVVTMQHTHLHIKATDTFDEDAIVRPSSNNIAQSPATKPPIAVKSGEW